MNRERMNLGGALFMVAGAAFTVVGFMGQRGVFFVLGCACIALGGAFLAMARRPPVA